MKLDARTLDMFSPLMVKESELAKARRLRDAGIMSAVEHADSVSLGWSDVAVAYIRAYAASHATLTAEQVRKYAESRGLSLPPDKRSWGGVMLTAKRSGVIEAVGWTRASDPKVHCNAVTLWKSRLWHGVLESAAP